LTIYNHVNFYAEITGREYLKGELVVKMQLQLNCYALI
ncbi:unnamed protein product, partial [marine sediment metagenome]